MTEESAGELVRRLQGEEIDRLRAQWPFAVTRPERVYPPLPEAEPGSPIKEEWDLFRAQVDELIRDGKRGKYAVVRVGHPITVWDSLGDALQAARLVYGDEKCMIQEVLPYLRGSRTGYLRCHG
jgi:hypothetical protein